MDTYVAALEGQLQQRVTQAENYLSGLFGEESGGGTSPLPMLPDGQRSVYYRVRHYRFVRFGGQNSRIETLDGKPDPTLRGQTTTTIPNSQLFNDAEGLRPITSVDHP